MWSWLEDELSIKNLSLRLDDVSVFTTSSILLAFILFIFRLATTIFCTVCLICSGFQDSSGETKWFIYLTDWSFTILTVTFILLSNLSGYHVYYGWSNRFQNTQGGYGTFETSIEAARMREASEVDSEILSKPRKRTVIKPFPCRWYHQMTWLFYNVSFCAGILVTVAYWSFVVEGSPGFIDVSLHALNSFFILVEFFLGRVPMRLLHAVYTMLYAAVYIIFSVIYWKAGGLNADNEPYIYDALDYENGSAAPLVGKVLSMVFIAPPLCQLFLYGLYKLRSYWFDPFNMT